MDRSVQRIRPRLPSRSSLGNARGTWMGLEPNIAIWKRNMRIFADIAAHAGPGERVFVVYGAGHAYFFRKWVLQHPRLELVEPADYLP